MNPEVVKKIKRYLAVIFGTLTWFVSVNFSNDGFNFEIKDMLWAGYVLAIAISVVELAFNSQMQYKGRRNYTLFALGIFSYIYGVFSNLIGIHYSQGFSDLPSILENPVSGMFKLSLALFAEFAPEVLIVYGLVGIAGDGDGDFLANLLGIQPGNQNPGQGNKQQHNQQQHHSKTDEMAMMAAGGNKNNGNKPQSREDYYKHGGQGPKRK